MLVLEHEAAPHCLLESLLPRKVEHEREIKSEPYDGRDFERVTSAGREPLGPKQHGVTHGLRERKILAPNELCCRPTLSQQPARSECICELLDEEGNSLAAIVEHGGQRRTHRTAEEVYGESSGLHGVERFHHELAEAPGATEVRAQAPDRMAARHFIASVGTDHDDGLLLERDRKRRQKLERCVVSPVQVVQKDSRRPRPGNRLECAADRFEERGTVGRLRPRTQLRENQCQVLGERTTIPEPARLSPKVRTERGDDWAIGRRRPLDRRSGQNT